jgi:hypothetical protein
MLPLVFHETNDNSVEAGIYGFELATYRKLKGFEGYYLAQIQVRSMLPNALPGDPQIEGD